MQNPPIDYAYHKRQRHGRIMYRPVPFERKRHFRGGRDFRCTIDVRRYVND